MYESSLAFSRAIVAMSAVISRRAASIVVPGLKRPNTSMLRFPRLVFVKSPSSGGAQTWPVLGKRK